MPAAGSSPFTPRTCCPPGYGYTANIGCVNPITHDVIPAEPCACCPVGYTMLTSDFTFLNPTNGIWMKVGNPDPTFLGHCVQVVNLGSLAPWAIFPPDRIVPTACPCCPDGYTYDNISGLCMNGKGKGIPTVPCINCVSVTPTPCQDCQESGGLSISFALNDTIKQCTDCGLTGEPSGLGGELNRLLPLQIADPIINFKRY